MRLIAALGLFTTATLLAQTPSPKAGADIAALRKIADEYYAWRNENFPVFSSDSGLHTWDNRLTDYSAAKIAARAQHIQKLLEQVRAMPGAKWPKEDRIDWMLFRAQLEGAEFGSRVLQSEKTDP